MRLLLSLFFALFVVGCQIERDGDTSADVDSADVAETPATGDDTPAAPRRAPAAGTACLVMAATAPVTLYARPGVDADTFGVLTRGDTLRPTARTEDGWLGFDPASAQAANVGPFRLRWVAPDAAVRLQGACARLPEVEKLPSRTCFVMAGAPIPLYGRPDTVSFVVDSLARSSFAPVLERTPAGWARVEREGGRSAWVSPVDGDYNGPCEGAGAP
ncbi:MAG TPA: SH3 domain-containing protein [Rhodothermales bacterium]|nr:SH3 domain-containing protein [Rhodothermales bacterium]